MNLQWNQLCRQALIFFAAGASVARGDTIAVHNLVYLDETGLAYSVDPTGGQIHQRPIRFQMVLTNIDGLNQQVPTASSTSDHTVTLGSLVMLEPDSTPSDLINWVVSNRKDYLQFFSNIDGPDDPGYAWADVGILQSIPNGAQTCVETDLSNTTMMLTYKGRQLNSNVSLAGDMGCVYVASKGMPGADTASGEDPIGYVFVSDRVAPEASSWLLTGSGVLCGAAGVRRRRRGKA